MAGTGAGGGARDFRHCRHASAGTRLLAAIRAAFDRTEGGDLSSAELMGKLTAEPDSEWAEWRSGKPITQANLRDYSGRLAVAPAQVRITTISRSADIAVEQFVEELGTIRLKYPSGARVAFETVTSVTNLAWL